ncbi:unnamed protein product, partial [Polarella glacialis]
ALRLFSVSAEGEKHVSLELASVLEVKKDVLGTPFSDLLQLPAPHEVSGEQLERRVICVTYKCEQAQLLPDGSVDQENKPAYLALLMPNQYERERFYTCMNILRWALTSSQRSA